MTRIKERLETWPLKWRDSQRLQMRLWHCPISRYRSPIRTAVRRPRAAVVLTSSATMCRRRSMLIVAHEVITSGSDGSQVANRARKPRPVLEGRHARCCRRSSYFKGEDSLACEQSDITVTLPKPMTSGAKVSGCFGKQGFAYLNRQLTVNYPGKPKPLRRADARSPLR